MKRRARRGRNLANGHETREEGVGDTHCETARFDQVKENKVVNFFDSPRVLAGGVPLPPTYKAVLSVCQSSMAGRCACTFSVPVEPQHGWR